ncbi:hypothetical protein RCL1_001584 [Eukaryota sp. TZLM3-RCL]
MSTTGKRRSVVLRSDAKRRNISDPYLSCTDNTTDPQSTTSPLILPPVSVKNKRKTYHSISTSTDPPPENTAPSTEDTDHDLPSICMSNFECPICLNICLNPVETSCCHYLFCSSCQLTGACPMCRQANVSFTVNHFVRRVLHSLPINCFYCNHKTTRGDLVVHLRSCSSKPASFVSLPDPITPPVPPRDEADRTRLIRLGFSADSVDVALIVSDYDPITALYALFTGQC